MIGLRLRLRRMPALWWSAVTVLALVTGGLVARIVGDASALARRYGPLEPMVVAADDVAYGEVLEPSDLAVAAVPASLAPPGRVADPAALVGRRALAPLVARQPVVAAHLAPDGVTGVAALLPAGTRAVAVPTGGASAPVARGDRVDVLATFDPALAGGGDPTRIVASEALVVDVVDDAATVAVAPTEAMALAFAASNGALTLALAPPVPDDAPTGSSPASGASSTGRATSGGGQTGRR